MTIRKNRSAAALLTRQLKSTKAKPAKIEDEFSKAVARRLESRGIAVVPGVRADESQPEWYDLAIEHHARSQAHRAEQEAKRQAEADARNSPQTTAGILAAAIRGQVNSSGASRHIPLNGAAVLRAALAGRTGTINSPLP